VRAVGIAALESVSIEHVVNQRGEGGPRFGHGTTVEVADCIAPVGRPSLSLEPCEEPVKPRCPGVERVVRLVDHLNELGPHRVGGTVFGSRGAEERPDRFVQLPWVGSGFREREHGGLRQAGVDRMLEAGAPRHLHGAGRGSFAIEEILQLLRKRHNNECMNLILFEEAVENCVLSAPDARFQHIRRVLRRGVGDSVDVGVVNGPRGAARVEAIDAEGCRLRFTWGAEPSELYPCDAWIALPRPAAARRILRECASLGVRRLVFFGGAKGEGDYATARLWRERAWREHLCAGAAQAFHTRIPEVSVHADLRASLRTLDPGGRRIALDLYEAEHPLTEACSGAAELCLAIGAERGWSAGERDLLREHDFVLCHLGERALRSDTACIAAVGAAAAACGWWERPWRPQDRS